MLLEFLSPEEKVSREELIKTLSDLRGLSLEELEKQNEKLQYAHIFYRTATSHVPVWEYQKFRRKVIGDFALNRTRVDMKTSRSLVDVRVFLGDVLGVDCSGASDVP